MAHEHNHDDHAHDHNHDHVTPLNAGETDLKIVKKELPNSEVELEITVPAARVSHVKEHVYKELAPTVTVSGFRPGKAPRNLIEARLGARLLEHTFDHLIPDATNEAIVVEKLSPLDYVSYSLGKIDTDGSLTFTAKIIVFPEVELPDFKKITAKTESIKVEEKEIEEMFKKLQDDVIASKKKETVDNKDGATASDSSDKQDTDTTNATVEIDWTEFFNDEKYKTDADVKSAIKESLEKRKTEDEEERYVTDLINQAIEMSNIPLPTKLLEEEIKRREKDYTQRIENLGIKLEDFLKAQNTDIDGLRKNWEQDAKLIISSDLLFLNIARAHKLAVSDEEVAEEISKVQDPELKKDYSTAQGRNKIATVLLRQKSLAKLKELSGK